MHDETQVSVEVAGIDVVVVAGAVGAAQSPRAIAAALQMPVKAVDDARAEEAVAVAQNSRLRALS